MRVYRNREIESFITTLTLSILSNYTLFAVNIRKYYKHLRRLLKIELQKKVLGNPACNLEITRNLL